MAAAINPFHSKFGGMWIDRADFREVLAEKQHRGHVDDRLAAQLVEFERDGVVIIKGAVDKATIASFEIAISGGFRLGHEKLLCQALGSQEAVSITPQMERRGARVVDSFGVLTSALDLFSTPDLLNFLRAAFQEDPLIFQSLSFDLGSEQGLHQDTAYVVVDRPMEMIACWIALEDVQPGTGELQYLVGSHRLPDYQFNLAEERKHWNSELDGMASHEMWAKWLHSEGARRGLELRKFLPEKGDILIWHADLAHGGSPLERLDSTRKSLVGHFCPNSATPHYMTFRPDRRTRRDYRGLHYSSYYYDLAEAG